MMGFVSAAGLVGECVRERLRRLIEEELVAVESAEFVDAVDAEFRLGYKKALQDVLRWLEVV